MNHTVLIYFRELHKHPRLIAHVLINSYAFAKDALCAAAQAQVFHNLSLLYTDRIRAEDRFELLYLKNGIPTMSESWYAHRPDAVEDAAKNALADKYMRLADAGVVMVREQQNVDKSLSLTFVCESLYQAEPLSPRMA
jgi:hypothetical protein